VIQPLSWGVDLREANSTDEQDSSLLDAEVTVLLTSVGNEAIHGFAADLRRRAPKWRLIGVDARHDAAGLYVCDHGYAVPRRESAEFLPTLARICRSHDVDVVLPLSTEDQNCFAAPEMPEKLNVRAIVTSAPEAVRSANSKIGLYRALGDHADLLPEYEVVDHPDQALASLERLVDRYGAALLKADVGTGASGMLCVGRPASDASPAANRVWWPLPAIRSIAACLDGGGSAPEPLSVLLDEPEEGAWPRLAVQYLPGQEFSVDILARDGATLGGVVRLRHHAVAGLAIAATTVVADDIWEAATRVTEALALSYVNNVQFRRDAGGAPKLMEINPRVPGTIGLTVESGLNLPLAACCLALGEQIELPEPEMGVHVLRHFGSVFTRSLVEPLDGE